jgi:hypothetical protein
MKKTRDQERHAAKELGEQEGYRPQRHELPGHRAPCDRDEESKHEAQNAADGGQHKRCECRLGQENEIVVTEELRRFLDESLPHHTILILARKSQRPAIPRVTLAKRVTTT